MYSCGAVLDIIVSPNGTQEDFLKGGRDRASLSLPLAPETPEDVGTCIGVSQGLR